MKRQTFAKSVLREEWDSATRRYSRWDEGGRRVENRAFTAEEDAEIDAALAATQAEANETAVTAMLGDGVFDELRALANGAGTLTTGQRDTAIRTCARGLVLLIRLQLRRFETTD